MRKVLLIAAPICLLGLVAGVVLASGAGDRATGHAKSVHRTPGLLLGNARLESHRDALATGRWAAFRFRASAGGKAKWITLFVDRKTRSKAIQVAIYRDSGGHPGVRLTSGSKRTPATGGWNHVAIKPVGLVRGHTYWLAIVGTGGSLSYRDRTHGSCTNYQSAHEGLGGLPSHWAGRAKLHRCALSATAVSRLPVTRQPAPPTTPTPPTTPAPPTTPTPPPNPGKNCASQPSACGFPDASNAGLPAGTPVTPVGQANLPSGVSWTGQGMTISANGVTLSNLEIPGDIEIEANNVTIKDCLIDDSSAAQAVRVNTGYTGTVVENTTIAGSDAGSGAMAHGIQGNGVTVNSVYIHFAEEGVTGGGLTVTNSYIVSDGLPVKPPGDHNEAIDLGDGTSTPTLIQHNTLFNPIGQTAAIIAGGPWGQLQNVRIDNNLMGGGGYTLYCCETDAWGVNQAPGNTSITNNRFSRLYYKTGGSYGPLADLDTSHTPFTGNVWDDTLKPVSP
jgi:hypothetical protein